MGLDRTRWTLGLLAQEMEAIGDIPEGITRGGFSKLLDRLGISYKRGRQRMRSPDPDYEEKRQYADERLQEARTDPDVTLLYHG
jgi:transposase